MNNYPKRIAVPVDEEMKETLEDLASKELKLDGKPMKLGEYCRQIFTIFIEKVQS
jgi:hypothetical protein